METIVEKTNKNVDNATKSIARIEVEQFQMAKKFSDQQKEVKQDIV